MRYATTSGINSSFPELSQSLGQVAYVLRTRSPLSHPRIATLLFSLDLHVLTTPPAFTLSQNQTLRIKYLISYPKRLIPSLSVSLLRFLDSFFSLLNLRSAYALADICGGSHNRT